VAVFSQRHLSFLNSFTYPQPEVRKTKFQLFDCAKFVPQQLLFTGVYGHIANGQTP